MRYLLAALLAMSLAGCVTTGEKPEIKLVKHHRHHVVKAQEPIWDPHEPEAIPGEPEIAPPVVKKRWVTHPGFIGYRGKHVRWYIDTKHHKAGLKVKR